MEAGEEAGKALGDGHTDRGTDAGGWEDSGRQAPENAQAQGARGRSPGTWRAGPGRGESSSRPGPARELAGGCRLAEPPPAPASSALLGRPGRDSRHSGRSERGQ